MAILHLASLSPSVGPSEIPQEDLLWGKGTFRYRGLLPCLPNVAYSFFIPRHQKPISFPPGSTPCIPPPRPPRLPPCCFFLMPALETREDTGQIHLLCMLLQKSMTSPLTLHLKYIKLIWRKKDNYHYKLKGDKLSAYLTERRACDQEGVTGVLRVGTPRSIHHMLWGHCHEPRAVSRGTTIPAHT